jgi:uncharacterized protein (TIGR03437 family)
MYAIGLGPTRPGVDPGSAFPSDPVQFANSPIEVRVNGAPAEVLYAGGYAGTTDGFQINFRVPAGVPSGIATLQLSAAWVSGAAVKIPIQ